MSIIVSLRIITRNITAIILTELFIYLIFLLQATIISVKWLRRWITTYSIKWRQFFFFLSNLGFPLN
jgi:hypothetical protein